MNSLFAFFYLVFYLIYSYIESFVHLFISRSKKSVDGKIVLVTGAGRGIGRELALQFSRLGAKLVLWDIDKKQNEEVANEIVEDGCFAKAYTVNVTDIDNIKTAAREVRRDVGHVQILINNAGVANGGGVLDMRENDIRRVIEINTVSHFWTVREFLPAMIERNDGHIVAISSIAGRMGLAYFTDYAASKFAVAGFMEALQDEMRREGHPGLHFTTVFPGFVNTGIIKLEKIKSQLLPAVETDWAVSRMVDGICRNKTKVYIPGFTEPSTRTMGLLPEKFFVKLKEVTNMGIDPMYE